MSSERGASLPVQMFSKFTMEHIAAYMHYLYISLSTMKSTKASIITPSALL